LTSTNPDVITAAGEQMEKGPADIRLATAAITGCAG
jgi:hypothetical protein